MILLSLLLVQAAAAPPIAVDRIDQTSFRLTLAAEEDIGIDAGQARLLPTARMVCRQQTPVFGRYKLEAEPTGNPPLRFEQELVCGSPAPVTPAAASDPQWQPSIAHQRAALAASYAYFAARDSGRFEDAHALFTDRMKQLSPLAHWRANAAAFAAAAGAPRGRRVVELSWYNNPPDAPEPGLYVAADFEGEFTGLHFLCGYLMWRMQPDGSFRLAREEQNYADRQMGSLSSLDRAPLRAQMGCKD